MIIRCLNPRGGTPHNSILTYVCGTMLLQPLHFDALQVWAAGQNAGNAGQMVHARLDVPRFAQLNTVKGRWALLSDLGTMPLKQQTAAPEAAIAVVDSGSHGVASARPVLQKDAVVRIVREVAAGMVSDTDLEGVTAYILQTKPNHCLARTDVTAGRFRQTSCADVVVI